MTTSGSSIVSSLLSGSAGGDVIEAETSISASNVSGNDHRGDDNGNMLTPFLSGRTNDRKEKKHHHKRVHSRHDSSYNSDRYTNFNDVLSVPSNDSHSHNYNHPLLPHQCTQKSTRRYCRRLYDRLATVLASNRFAANYCAPCLDRLTPRQRTILARFLTMSTLLTVVVAVPALTYLAAYERHTGSMGEFRALFYSAGIFVSLTIPLSVHTIVQHLTNWYMPDVQKFVVRILFMVPIYSVQSWMSLRFHGSSTLIDTVRGLYEAFVIASFVYYLVGLLGGEECMADMLSKKDARYGKHPAVLRVVCGVRDWTMGDEFLLKCKQGALQYVVFKSMSTIAVVVLESTGLYGEGTFGFGSAYLYITALMNMSVSWALYCLVKLYYATRDELRRPVNWHPAGKFLCVKGVVFWTFWQGVLIYILHVSGVLDALHLLPTNYGRGEGERHDDDASMDSNYMAGCLQDYLVCIEMLLFAVAHRYAFTYEEYVTAARLDAAGDDEDDLFWIDYHNQDVDDDDNDDLLADVDTDGGGSGRGGDGERGEDPDGAGEESSSSLLRATSSGDADATYYSTPVIRRLYEPLGAGRAFRAATVPSETVADIRRLGVWGASGARVERVHEVDFRLENAESI